MKRKLINSQLSNFKTYKMYLRQLLTLAENVFKFENMPDYLDIAYINKILLHNGAIAFFEDEEIGLLALPFTPIGRLDVYGRPVSIQVYGQNGYNRILNKDEFVIMYDNNGMYPLYLDICQYAERLALDTRTTDINISQQKTPRFWKCNSDNKKTVEDLINNIDGNENAVLTYENLNVDDITLICEPAPFVADKIDLHKDKDWSEFLRLVGIANMSFQKKERNISDEITAMQGGTIASRYSRFEPRKRAIKLINEKFAHLLEKEIEVSYYDGEPQSKESEMIDDVSIYDDSDDSDDSNE